MTADAMMALLVTWRPAARPSVVRIGALYKLGAGVRIDRPEDIKLEVRQPAGAWVALQVEGPRPSADGPLTGPLWCIAAGRLIDVSEKAAEIRGSVANIVSRPVRRPHQTECVSLHTLGPDFGLPGEPHLRWRFENTTDAPVDVWSMLTGMRLRLDGQDVRPPVKTYNGPSALPPQRELTGVWSFDDIDPQLRRRGVTIELDVLGRRSAPVTWTGTTTEEGSAELGSP